MGYVTLAEIANASVPTPASGKESIFFDTSDSQPKWKNSAGTTTTLVPNSGVYRTIAQAHCFATSSALTNATYFPAHDGTVAVQGTSAAKAVQGLFYSRTADYAQTGMTTKYQVSAQLHTNATAPTITVVCGLHAVTAVAGTAGNLQYTIGAATAGSTVTFTTQGASTQGGTTASGDFNIPANGYYALCLVPSGAGAANSILGLSMFLQQRNV